MCLTYLDRDARDIVWQLVKTAFASVADYAIVPMQDLLELAQLRQDECSGSRRRELELAVPCRRLRRKACRKAGVG